MPSSCISSKIGLFADDAKAFRKINIVTDSLLLQVDIDMLYKWSVIWKMDFNPSKCKVLTVSRRKAPVVFNYNLNGIILEHVTSFRDLGVLVAADLSWKGHIETVVGKCNRVNGMIKRVVGYHAPPNVSLNLYKSLTRSITEYSSPVWSPQTTKELKQLESVQRNMTRFITRFDGSSYKERCIHLNILPLCYRREISDLVFFYKCIHSRINFNLDNLCQYYDQTSSRRSAKSGLLLKSLMTRTEVFKQSYFNRIVSEWNLLPLVIRDSSSLYSFKHQLSFHYANKLDVIFNTDNICTWTSTCRCQKCVCDRSKQIYN